MKLYIKQKVFSFRDRFTVKDETGADMYYVEGEIFTFGKKLHIYDTAGAEAAFISQKVFSFMPRYLIYKNGFEIAQIVKKFTLLYQEYVVDGLGLTVEGDFFSHNYSIMRGDNAVAVIHKEWFSWGDSYSIDIADGEDEVIALAVVLAIDCVLDSSRAAAASSSGANH